MMTPEQIAARKQGFWWAAVAAAMTCLMLIIWIGTFYFAKYENMETADAMYFTIVTISTVGYGDFAPESTAGKIFSLFYIPLSVAFTAGLIDSIAGTIMLVRQVKQM